MLVANIFTVIDEVIWSEHRCLPHAVEARFWRAFDQLRRVRLTQEVNDLFTDIGVLLFKLCAAAPRKDAGAEMIAIKYNLTEARRRCLPKLSMGALAG